jgi:DNA-binding NtrC family response regulator
MPAILIVDDDVAIRDTLYELLSDQYQCTAASTASEALQHLDVETYDVVLTDLTMPELSGIDLLQLIRARGMDIPVVFISGRGSETYTEELIKLGAFGYVTKPFNLDDIENIVARALESKKN